MGLFGYSMLEIAVLSAGIAWLVVGAALTWMGRRGKRIDDHPVCRRCGFDLTGRPETSTRCAECGADLLLRRTIRIGNREPRRGMIWGGLSILAVWMLVAGVGVWLFFSKFDVMPYKPVWLLRAEASSTTMGRRAPAITELSRRLAAGGLTDDHIHAVIADAILLQPDMTFPWNEWTGLLDRLVTAGKIGDEQWTTLVVQATKVSLRTRPKVRAGDPMPIELVVELVRMPSNPTPFVKRGNGVLTTTSGGLMRLSLPQSVEMVDLSIEGMKPQGVGAPFLMSPQLASPAVNSMVGFNGSQTAELIPGEHPISSRVRIKVSDPGGKAVIATVYRDVSGSVTIIPGDTDPSTLFGAGPGLGEKMKAAIVPTLSARSGIGVPSLHLNFSNLPAGLSHRAFIRLAGGEELEAGLVEWRGVGGGMASRGVDVIDQPFVDVILRPDLDRLLATTRRDPVCGEEIVFEKVPVLSALTPRARGNTIPLPIPLPPRGGR